MNKHKKISLFIISALFAACSPKVITVPKSPEPTPKQEEVKVKENKSNTNIAVLLPLKLKGLQVNKASKSEIDKRIIPLDFYQGLKLGLDSAAKTGININLNVYDSEERTDKLEQIYSDKKFKESDLVIGPIFPDGVKYISNYSKLNNLPIISPLSASKPSEFANPNLISIVSNIDIHASAIVNHIAKKYNENNTIVVLINPKRSEDELLASPIRKYLSALKRPFIVQEYASSFAFETKMQKDKNYVVVVTSSTKNFVDPTLDKLIKLNNNYPINLIGHPNWLKQNYNTEKLQKLNTIVGTSYHINYKDSQVIKFVNNYKNKFKIDPSEYAFKGFDIGYYFGKLVAKHGDNYLNYITKDDFKGLHNTFTFEHDKSFGYVNNHVTLLQYKNFQLNTVE